jgi:hypothetical protein
MRFCFSDGVWIWNVLSRLARIDALSLICILKTQFAHFQLLLLSIAEYNLIVYSKCVIISIALKAQCDKKIIWTSSNLRRSIHLYQKKDFRHMDCAER